MAYKPRKRKVKKNVPEGKAYIHSTFNNTIVTISDKDGNAIKNIWAQVMESAEKNVEGNVWYEIPQNVLGVMVEPVTGKVATAESKKKKMLYYIKGTEPYDDSPDLDALVPTTKTQ